MESHERLVERPWCPYSRYTIVTFYFAWKLSTTSVYPSHTELH